VSNIDDFYIQVVESFLNSSNLSSDPRKWLTQTKSVQELFQAVQAIQDAKSPGKRSRIAAFFSRLSRSVLCTLDHLSPAIETFTSSHPEIANLAWGAIKLVLMVTWRREDC
jgi:hypothetical protein